MRLADRRALLVPVIAILGFVLGIYVAPSLTSVSVTSNSESGIKYWSEVCVSKNGVLIQCDHNVFTDRGKNVTKEYLTGRTSNAAITAIAVGNGSTPTATTDSATSGLNGEIAECGLSRAAGTFSQNNTAGVWFVERVFTVSTCGGTIRVNTTGLLNSTAVTNTNFTFAANSFTNADLQNNDQLNVTWTIAVT